jgi:steroid 5-alpha reductase family enzyme
MQLSFFAVAYNFQIDKVTDFAGAMNFLLLAWLSFGLGGTHFIRQWVITGIVTLWALRLGFFLLQRVLQRGHDARFDEMRSKFWSFLGFWIFQIIWIWVVSLPGCSFINNRLYWLGNIWRWVSF